MLTESQRRTIFEEVYASHAWGGNSRSGPGSDPTNTAKYVRFVNNWLERHPDCVSIVELGCGAWATTRLIKLSSQHTYLGLDIVPALISANREKYQFDNVKFECYDFLSQFPPNGDLLLIKDVLQHLSNDNVQQFLKRILPGSRYAIITNDIYSMKRVDVLVCFQ
jgi:SAM-dependent methyltransferase